MIPVEKYFSGRLRLLSSDERWNVLTFERRSLAGADCGLQIHCGAVIVLGGFDSRAPPLILHLVGLLLRSMVCSLEESIMTVRRAWFPSFHAG